MEILASESRGYGAAPRCLVRCPACSTVYVVCQWRHVLRRQQRCGECAQRNVPREVRQRAGRLGGLAKGRARRAE